MAENRKVTYSTKKRLLALDLPDTNDLTLLAELMAEDCRDHRRT